MWMDGERFGEPETVHHHGEGRKSPPEISLLEQRTRLILCQGDTIYHGVISLAQREGTQAEWDVW